MGTSTPGPLTLTPIQGQTTWLPFQLPDDDFNVWTIYGENLTNASLVGDSNHEVIQGHSVLGNNNRTSFDQRKEEELSAVGLWKGIPLGIVLSLLCLLTTSGNVLVLHAVRTEKRLQTVSNLYIVSLAIADVIVGIVVMPISALYIFTDDWVMGVAICQIWMGVDYTASTASILNLFILSLDRYWSVRQPLQYLHKRTKKRALTFISVVWLASSLWIIPIVSWHYIAHGGVRTVASNECDTEYAKNMPFKLVTAFFNFYLPLTIMYILYFRVFSEIRKRSEFEMGQRNPGGTVLSYKSNVNNTTSQEISDGGETSSYQSCCRLNSSVRSRDGGNRTSIGATGCRNVKLLAVKRLTNQSSSASRESKSLPYKVEYVYDENVIDPKTEKIERYFYEEHFPLPSNRSRSSMIELDGAVGASGGCTSNSLQQRNANRMMSSRSANGPIKFHASLSSPSSLSPFSLSKCGNASKPQRVMTTPWTGRSGKSLDNRTFDNNKSFENRNFENRGFFRRNGKLQVNIHPNSVSAHRGRSDSYSKLHLRQETSFSPPVFSDITEASSSSSASTFDDKGIKEDRDLSGMSRRQRDSFSILSGIRKIRNAGSFIECTTRGNNMLTSNSAIESGTSNSNGPERPDGLLVLHHEDQKRPLGGNVIAFKERLKVKRPSSSLKKEIKAARQLGVIMGAFTLCFLPYFILFMVVSICDNCVDPGLLTAATWIGYLNSTLNPFLYPLCNVNFRTKFKSMLRCCGNRPHTYRTSRDSRNGYPDRLNVISSRYD